MENAKSAPRDLFPGALEMSWLYPALQRLLKAKLVKAEWTVSPATNRRVRIYEITKAGLRRVGPTRGTANS